MNPNIEQLLTLIAKANDTFMDQYKQISTTVGILEKALQGSNAVTVDNIVIGQKLMFIILDQAPHIVGVGVGKIGTEEFSFIEQYQLTDMTENLIVDYLKAHLVSKVG
jgi:hypothetical protein